MTPDVRRKVFGAIRECLRRSPVADSLPDDWEERLFGEHRRFPERDRAVCTTLEVEFGCKPGWFVLEQGGGGIAVHLWSPDGREPGETREAMEALRDCLTSVLSPSVVWVRYAAPREWLSRKGWPLKNGAGR